MRKKSMSYLFAALLMHHPQISKLLSDKLYLKLVFRGYVGKKLDLKKPYTFNEKIQWLKLYDRNPDYVKMVDKYEAKKYVSSIIGSQYIIPTLGVWDSFDSINFDDLPNRFVLKCTHDSGSTLICTDKQSFDRVEAKKFFNKKMENNYYWYGREWPYKNIKPRIIAEEYIEDITGDLKDYKIFTFNGEAKLMFVASNRQTEGKETTFDFYDRDFNHLNILNGHPNSKQLLTRPKLFDDMLSLAERLSINIPLLRVDFYEANGRLLFGELTFSHWSGLVPFNPDEWDTLLGSWIELPCIEDERAI